MSSGSFEFTSLLAAGLPAPAAKWTGFPKYNFSGGHNDADCVPVDELIAAAVSVLKREGSTLATYGLASGPLGYRPLREFLAAKLARHAGISCSSDEILITSGSLQAIDLVNGVLLDRGDTVLIEQETYGGALTRLARLGVNALGIPLDAEGLRMDALAGALDDLKRRGIRAKYIYTIPTVQNPTGTIMGEQRRCELLRLSQAHGVPIFEDECYSDLDLGRQTAASDLCHERARRRHSHRLLFQVGRAGTAGRLHRCRLGDALSHAGAQDRRRFRRLGADGAGRILRRPFQ